MQSAFAAARGEGELEETMISAAQEQERTKVVQNKPPSSHLVCSPIIADHDPFEQIIMNVTATKAFRRRPGRGGARRTISPLSLS